jgi:hypothetical protein
MQTFSLRGHVLFGLLLTVALVIGCGGWARPPALPVR